MNKPTARADLAPAVLTVPTYGSVPRLNLDPLATVSSHLLTSARDAQGASQPATKAAHRAIELESESDVAGFRHAARRLLVEGVAPDGVSWHVATQAEGDLFGPSASALPGASAGTPEGVLAQVVTSPVTVPSFFLPLCERAALHSDPGRFGLLYRLLWRMVREPGLRHDPLDADRMQAEQMARAVRRDMHKMTAFVRFRPLAAAPDDDWGITQVAWFEPAHHIVEATAPFFAWRFAQMRWAILTPECSARWNGSELAFGPGARREDAPPADADERLWLTYYQSIFNPARLKIRMMQKEMPRRYWKNLPEATLIHPLTLESAQRSGQMIEQGGSDAKRRRPVASVALRIAARPVQAQDPVSLAALAQATERCRACPIGQFATQAVSGEGPLHARLMLVGEQPGDREDLHGRPFVGPAGKLLDQALARLGWPRETLYLTNAVKHFKFEPRGKGRMHKTASQREAAACADWLEREIALVKPHAVIALGATAARSLMGPAVAVNAERGHWLERADGLRVLIALHPAALLRMEAHEFDAAFDAWVGDLAQAAQALTR